MSKTIAREGCRPARTAFLERSALLNITVPAPLAAALEGECRRTLRTRSEVVADLLAWALPRRLAEDLAHTLAGALVDADSHEVAV